VTSSFSGNKHGTNPKFAFDRTPATEENRMVRNFFPLTLYIGVLASNIFCWSGHTLLLSDFFHVFSSCELLPDCLFLSFSPSTQSKSLHTKALSYLLVSLATFPLASIQLILPNRVLDSSRQARMTTGSSTPLDQFENEVAAFISRLRGEEEGLKEKIKDLQQSFQWGVQPGPYLREGSNTAASFMKLDDGESNQDDNNNDDDDVKLPPDKIRIAGRIVPVHEWLGDERTQMIVSLIIEI
jgi:hypothetical protein